MRPHRVLTKMRQTSLRKGLKNEAVGNHHQALPIHATGLWSKQSTDRYMIHIACACAAHRITFDNSLHLRRLFKRSCDCIWPQGSPCQAIIRLLKPLSRRNWHATGMQLACNWHSTKTLRRICRFEVCLNPYCTVHQHAPCPLELFKLPTAKTKHCCAHHLQKHTEAPIRCKKSKKSEKC